MPYIFFYASIIGVWVLFLICLKFRPLHINSITIGIASIAYSLVFDITLGNRLGLFHYITPGESTMYMVLGAIFIYSGLNIIYTMFLPEKVRPALIYTAVWVAAMLVFEYGSLLARTIVFTGWTIFPWSVITYLFTYLWINLLFRYLEKNCRVTGNYNRA